MLVGILSCALCAVSCGERTESAVKTVKAFLDHSETSLKRVIFNVFKDSDWEIYSNILKING